MICPADSNVNVPSEDVFNINHDGEEREVEVVPLPFSSRLEKME